MPPMSEPIPTLASPEVPTVDETALRSMLADERDRRARACQAEIQDVLARHRCEMHPYPTLLPPDGRLAANIAIVAKE